VASRKTTKLTAVDFRRIALSFEGATEGSHMGAPDFRVGGRIFATLASQAQGFGNLMIDPEHQAEFVADAPDIFLPIAGGWGRMGMTHIRLDTATEEAMEGALRTAWKLRVDKNAKTSRSRSAAKTKAGPRRARKPPGRLDPPC
jgi:hypothetical protein